jgi:hypothetical protein
MPVSRLACLQHSALGTPRERDLKVCLALAPHDPKIGIAFEACAKFEFHLVRPFGQVADRLFKQFYEVANRSQRGFKSIRRHRGNFVLRRYLREPRGAAAKVELSARDFFCRLIISGPP